MIVYFDTVKRTYPVREAGELVKLDWSAKKVLKTVPVYPFDPDIEEDSNPRGNSRGGKGMLLRGDELFVGSYHSLLVFDPELNLKRKINNTLFVNIHELCGDGENLWVSSTAIDCALQINPEGKTLKSFWPREEGLLQEKFGLRPMDIDKTADNRLIHLHSELSARVHHTHLNSVVKCGNKTYALLNKPGVVVQIEPSVKVVFEDPLIRGGHSLSVSGNLLMVCGSIQRCILIFDPETGKKMKQIDLLHFPEIAALYEQCKDQPFNQSIFVSGLEILDDERILAGISPASVLEIDIRRNRLLGFFRYSPEVSNAVHGLVCRHSG